MKDPKATRVYGWTQHYIRGVDNTTKQFNQSWRLVVAAPSKAAVGRITGCPPRQLWCLGETGNDDECAVARTAPGTVFFAVDATRIVDAGDATAFRPLSPATWVRT